MQHLDPAGILTDTLAMTTESCFQVCPVVLQSRGIMERGLWSGRLKAAFLTTQVGPTLGQTDSLTTGGQRMWVADSPLPFPSLFLGPQFSYL